MAADTIKLDILTPLGPRRSGIEVPAVEIPAVQGELGILPHHEPLVTAIVPGLVRFREGADTTKIAVGKGFVEVKAGGRVAILVERAAEATEVAPERVRERLREVERELAAYPGPQSDAKATTLAQEAQWLAAQLRVAG